MSAFTSLLLPILVILPASDASAAVLPEAVDDSATVAPGSSVDVDVLANDTDLDDDLLLVTNITSPPAVGTAEILGGGRFIKYTAPALFTGTTTFEYEVEEIGSAAVLAGRVLRLGRHRHLRGAVQDEAPHPWRWCRS